ncbi:MAG TPA: hypothetical protein VNA69_03985, partial [Thermoanaerobaculia bacterium]|nr:hypothetical protein [Thermoanaerobaculia bacterium]
MPGFQTRHPTPHPHRRARCALLVTLVAAACGGSTSPATPTTPAAGIPPPAAGDTQPFPIDHGAGAPTTYKGLPLRLVDNGEPVVTPVDDIIGLVCVGMSNGNQECATFIERVRGTWAGTVNPQVRVANCAVGGHAIERWNDPADDAALWDACIGSRLGAAGIRSDQVRVVYHKAANQFTTGPGNAPLPLYPSAGSP